MSAHSARKRSIGSTKEELVLFIVYLWYYFMHLYLFLNCFLQWSDIFSPAIADLERAPDWGYQSGCHRPEKQESVRNWETAARSLISRERGERLVGSLPPLVPNQSSLAPFLFTFTFSCSFGSFQSQIWRKRADFPYFRFSLYTSNRWSFSPSGDNSSCLVSLFLFIVRQR